MPLSADLTRQFQCIDDLLFAPLHFLQGVPPLDSHLQVETDDLDDLLVSSREPDVLFGPAQLALALNDELDHLILGHNRLDDELSVFVTVFDILWSTHCRFDFSLHITDRFN